MLSDQQRVFELLKNEGPAEWLAYISPFETSESQPPLSLLITFDHAALRAKREDSLEWANVAVRAAELNGLTSTGIAREQSRLNAMRMRSWAIAKAGSRAGDPTLDKEIVISWASEALTPPVETVRKKARELWGNLAKARSSKNPEDLQQVGSDLSKLRWIKHRLTVIKVLADCGELPADSTLNEWLKIREELP
jgi:hypothetical protein